MSDGFNLPLILDGATGTNLISAGMPNGVCLEKWILENPQVIKKLLQAYVDAGSNIVYAPTFGANRVSLSRYGLENKVEEINTNLVKLAREAVSHRALIAGDMSTTTLQIKPFGETDFEELIDIYTQQANALKKAGVDLIVCETLTSLSDARAAVIASQETNLPIFVSITIDNHGKTLSGSSLLICVLTLQEMGVKAIGVNCSTGPEDMLKFIKPVMPYTKVPIIAKPNAGRTIDRVLQNVVTPEEFAVSIDKLIDAGVRVVGGCCGTTPKHIEQIKWVLKNKNLKELPEQEDVVAACYENTVFFLGDDLVMSEPLECTSDLADDLFDLEDEVCNVALVKINDVSDADEFGENAYMARLPIALYSNNFIAMEKAIRVYQGRILIDTKSNLTQKELDTLVEKYGCILV